MKSFAVAPGLQVEVWAAEPHLANPVAFTFDDAGRAYVAETYRRRTSALDIRKYDEWIVPNLSLRSVEARIAFTKEKFPIEAKLTSSPTPRDAVAIEAFHDLFPRRVDKGLVVCLCRERFPLTRRVDAVPLGSF